MSYKEQEKLVFSSISSTKYNAFKNNRRNGINAKLDVFLKNNLDLFKCDPFFAMSCLCG